MTSKNSKQYGAVSLFVVIFSALLITIVTVSFVSIMIKNQQQATNSDLSQSAYDSAQAGVEDAKRALLQYQSVCNSGGDCNLAEQQINSSTCNEAVKTLTDISAAESDNEIKVQTGGNNTLDQAYTCVKISLQTNDYVGILTKETSKLVPLVGVTAFNTIKIDWFSNKDLQGTVATTDVPSFGSGTPLLSQSDWSSKILNRPSIMRAQLVKFDKKNGFLLSNFDSNNISASNNTLFLYPSNIVDSQKSFSSDIQRTSKSLTQVHCESNLSLYNYSCSATIKLPEAISSDTYVAYLNLTAIYKNTHYKVSLLNDSTLVKFDAVQPLIDSTGRTNDLFRRVETRVELTDTDFPYPDAAVYALGNLCKDFMITDSESDYSAGDCVQ